MSATARQSAEVLLAHPPAPAAAGVAAGSVFPEVSMSFPWAAQPTMNPVTDCAPVMAPPLASPKQPARWQYGTSLIASAPLSAPSPPHSASPTSSTATTSTQSVPVASPPPLSHLSAHILDEFMEGEDDGDELFANGSFEDIASMSEEEAPAHTSMAVPMVSSPAGALAPASASAYQHQLATPAATGKKIGGGRAGKKTAMTPKASVGGEDGAEEDGLMGSGEGVTADGKERPSYSYARLAAMAIEDDPRKKCTVGEIYLWIEQRFPFYKSGAPWWKNCIRHNLSMKKCFMRIQGQGGNLWALDPSFRDDILSDSPAPKSLLRKPRRSSTSSTTNEPTPVSQAAPIPRRNSSSNPQTKAPTPTKRKPSPKGTRNPTKPLKRSNSVGKIEIGSDPSSLFSGDEGTVPLGFGRRNSDGGLTPPVASLSLNTTHQHHHSSHSSSGAPAAGAMGGFDDASLLLEEAWLNDMMAGMDASASHSRVDTFSPQFRTSYTRLFQSPSSGLMPFQEDDSALAHATGNFMDPLFRLTPSGHLDGSSHLEWDLPSFA